MIETLKKLMPVRLRHQIVHRLPRPVRHGLVDAYIKASVHRGLRAGTPERDIAGYWEGAADDDANAPETYPADPRRWDVELVKLQADRLLGGRGRVLDFGCNAGRALHVFAEGGYTPVGVDINPSAVALAKVTFPILANAEFHVGDGANLLSSIPDRHADLVYTFAVLRHVSPNSIETVCRQLARIAKRYLSTFEDEGSLSVASFPRNYRHIFERMGYRQVHREYAIDHRAELDLGGLGTMFRFFERVDGDGAVA